MIHEVMILDHSGFDLALIHIGSWIKTGALATLAAGVVAATIPAAGVRWPVLAAIVAAIGLYIGATESFKARNRLSRNTTYIATTVALALLAFLLVYILALNINLELE